MLVEKLQFNNECVTQNDSLRRNISRHVKGDLLHFLFKNGLFLFYLCVCLCVHVCVHLSAPEEGSQIPTPGGQLLIIEVCWKGASVFFRDATRVGFSVLQ